MENGNISPKNDNIFCEESFTFDSNAEIDRLFSKCEMVRGEAFSPKQTYILHISATNEVDASIICGLSDSSCKLCKLSNSEIKHINNISEHARTIIGCRFSKTDNNVCYTGSSDGIFKLWDIRNPSKSSLTLTDTTVGTGKRKTFNCFDVSHNDRLLCAGTDLVADDAFLLFWDIRKPKLLGGYWQSHSDDITEVKFHPDNMNCLVSGSTDGLINIYDISQTREYDALVDSLNTESTVETLTWFVENGKYFISCVTHIADLQLWCLDDVKPYKHFRRVELAEAVMVENAGYMFVSSHQAKASLLVLVGTDKEDGESIRSLKITRDTIEPALGFKGKQRVRCSWYSPYTNLLLTGGEKGLLDIWKVKIKL